MIFLECGRIWLAKYKTKYEGVTARPPIKTGKRQRSVLQRASFLCGNLFFAMIEFTYVGEWLGFVLTFGITFASPLFLWFLATPCHKHLDCILTISVCGHLALPHCGTRFETLPHALLARLLKYQTTQ